MLRALNRLEASLRGAGVSLRSPTAEEMSRSSGGPIFLDPNLDISRWFAWGGPAVADGGSRVPLLGSFSKLTRDESMAMQGSAESTFRHDWGVPLAWDRLELASAPSGSLWPVAAESQRFILADSRTGAMYAQGHADLQRFRVIASSFPEMLENWATIIDEYLTFDEERSAWLPRRSNLDWNDASLAAAGFV